MGVKKKIVHKHKHVHSIMCDTRVIEGKTNISSFWEQVTCNKCKALRNE